MFSLGLTTIVSFLKISPLTETQRTYVFDRIYLYWIMYFHAYISSIITSFLTMTGTFLLNSLINFVSLEFEVFGTSMKRLLNEIKDEMTEDEVLRISDELKENVKYYERLLR